MNDELVVQRGPLAGSQSKDLITIEHHRDSPIAGVAHITTALYLSPFLAGRLLSLLTEALRSDLPATYHFTESDWPTEDPRRG